MAINIKSLAMVLVAVIVGIIFLPIIRTQVNTAYDSAKLENLEVVTTLVVSGVDIKTGTANFTGAIKLDTLTFFGNDTYTCVPALSGSNCANYTVVGGNAIVKANETFANSTYSAVGIVDKGTDTAGNGLILLIPTLYIILIIVGAVGYIYFTNKN